FFRVSHEPGRIQDNQMKHSSSSMNTSTGEKYFWCLLLLPRLIPQIFTYLSKFTIEDGHGTETFTPSIMCKNVKI
ncbi:9945_t:CDS:1, partial [Funneliformis caledonium]